MALDSDATILALLRLLTANDADLSALPNDMVVAIIDAMRPRVDDPFGDYGLALAVAHECTLAVRAGISPAGALTSEREGQLARSYGSPERTDPYWSTTGYGIRFIGLARQTLFTPNNRQSLDPSPAAQLAGAAAPLPGPPQAPQPPTGLSATTGATGQITLSWAASQGASYYTINQGNVSGAEVPIANNPFPNYTVSGLAPGGRFYFTVSAVNQNVNPVATSNPSNEATATAGV